MVTEGKLVFIRTALALIVIQIISFDGVKTIINLGKINIHTAALGQRELATLLVYVGWINDACTERCWHTELNQCCHE